MPSAAILAGGRSTRFGGRDKSALIVAGRSIMAHQLDELAEVADDILIVGKTATGAPREPRIRVVADRVDDRGPLAGLDAALAAARHDVLVVLACDMPFVTAGFLNYLVAQARETDVVVPQTEDGYHPLCAVYTRACQAAIADRLATGRLSVVGLLSDVRVRIVSAAEIEAFGGSRLLANVNTPAALEEIGALQSHQA